MMTVDDLTWIVPATLALAAIARVVRVGRKKRERAWARELNRYIRDCDKRAKEIEDEYYPRGDYPARR